jgi:hypothetical protein
MAEKNVVQHSDMPKYEHWAVLNYTHVNTPGYDKGDPDETKYIVEYIAFSTKEELEDWVYRATQGYDRKTFSVIFASPAKVETAVKVTVNTKTTRG